MAKVTLLVEFDGGSAITIKKDTLGDSAQQLLDEAYQEARAMAMLATQKKPEIPEESMTTQAEKRANPVSLVGL